LTNGQYQTKGTGTGTGYLNYSTYYYNAGLLNSLNYSGISASGYRYSTFTFKAAIGAAYTHIQFVVSGISQTIYFPGGDQTAPTVGSTRLYFYYRVEDADNYSTFNASYVNTTWLDATNTSNPVLSSGNYYNYTTYPVLSARNGSIDSPFSGTTYTINCNLNSLTVVGGNNYYIYFRVCAPMNENFWFSNVTAQFT